MYREYNNITRIIRTVTDLLEIVCIYIYITVLYSLKKISIYMDIFYESYKSSEADIVQRSGTDLNASVTV